jgi:maleylpyruvate isomerase
MKLYSRPLSPYSARVRVALYHKGIDFEHVVPEMGWSKDPAFLAVNPLGRIPVLVLADGTTLVESGPIVEYLDDAHPEPAMRPADPAARAQLRAFTQIVEHDVMATMMTVFGQVYAKQDHAASMARLTEGLRHIERMLEETPGVTIADAMLVPVRFNLDSLQRFAGAPSLLEPFPKIGAYRKKIDATPALARVWRELEEGLVAFMAWLAKQPAPQ